MAQIISLANQKGGVAKTTSAFNIGKCLALKGKRTLLIDFDSQASLTICSGLEPFDYENTIVSILSNENQDVRSCIIHFDDKTPDIITSRLDLAQMEMVLISRPQRETILKRALDQISDLYDYILIDCPPQLGILTINALACSDWVLIPVATNYLAYRGVEYLEETIAGIQEYVNPDLQLMGVIGTLHDTRLRDDRDILRALRKKYNVLGTVRNLSAGRRSLYDGIMAYDTSSRNPVAREYSYITDQILIITGGNQ